MLTKPDFMFKKIIVVFPHQGEKISFKNDNFVVNSGENKIKYQISCYKLFMVFIVGGSTITSGIIERTKKFGFSIILTNMNFKVYETINFEMEGNTLLREKQYNNNCSIDISCKIIQNKINNQIQTIDNLRDKKNNQLKYKLSNYVLQLENVKELNTIMGIEGNAAKEYFKTIFGNINWKGRKPRVKHDETNLLLDIGYTLLFNFIEAILRTYGFDIYKGNLHQEFYKRKSLVCDVIEPFRPIIDYRIRKMHSLKELDTVNFILVQGKYTIDWKDNTKIMMMFLEAILEYRECIFDYIQKYYRWFMKEQDFNNFPVARLKKNDIN